MTQPINGKLTIADALDREEGQYLQDALDVFGMYLEAQQAVKLIDWVQGKFAKPMHGIANINDPITYGAFLEVNDFFSNYRNFGIEMRKNANWGKGDEGLYSRHVEMDPDIRNGLELCVLEKLEHLKREFEGHGGEW